MAMLPLDVTSNILSRLPVKSLLRFRCVSKPFRSLIDSPEFAKLHLNRSIESNSNQSLILSVTDTRVSVARGFWYGKIFSSSLDSPRFAEELNHPFGNSYAQIIGSCNGLIAVKDCKEFIAVWNPSTKKYRMLCKFWKKNGTNEYTLDGFGYDVASDDYKLVRIMRFCKWVYVYSLKANSSRRIHGFPYYFLQNRECAYAAGALHWLASKNPLAHTEDLIVAFDLKKEEFYELPLPPDGNLHLVSVKTVDDVRGSLCVSPLLGGASPADVWIMKEYGVKESWTRLVSIPQHKVPAVFPYVKALTYSKSGDEVLLDKYSSVDKFELQWYNLKNGTPGRSLEIFAAPLGSRHSVVCLDSLVSVDAHRNRCSEAEQRAEKEETIGRVKDFISMSTNNSNRIKNQNEG